MEVRAPQAGRVVDLGDVPDPVFAAAMVGPGIAIAPEAEDGPVTAGAPVAGTLTVAKPHAFVVRAAGGSVLVHLGIDTVALRGDGFDVVAEETADVALGDAVVRWEPAGVAARGLATTVVVVALGAGAADLTMRARPGDVVAAGEVLFDWGTSP